MNKKIISTAAMLGLLRYARFSADPTAPVLTLDVVPSGEPGVLQVFFRKQLLAKAQVTVYAENGWEQNKLSDEQGQYASARRGPGGFTASVRVHTNLSSNRPRMQPDPIQLIQTSAPLLCSAC